MKNRYRLNHSITNTSIFWFFSAAYGYFAHQTRAKALKQGSQSITMLEKLQKCSYRLLWKIEIVPFTYLNVWLGGIIIPFVLFVAFIWGTIGYNEEIRKGKSRICV